MDLNEKLKTLLLCATELVDAAASLHAAALELENMNVINFTKHLNESANRALVMIEGKIKEYEPGSII